MLSKRLLAAFYIAVLSLPLLMANASEYSHVSSSSGVDVYMRYSRLGSGPQDGEVLVKFTNNNPYSVDITYELDLTCHDGNVEHKEGGTPARANSTVSGELSGLWFVCSDGEKIRTSRINYTVKNR